MKTATIPTSALRVDLAMNFSRCGTFLVNSGPFKELVTSMVVGGWKPMKDTPIMTPVSDSDAERLQKTTRAFVDYIREQLEQKEFVIVLGSKDDGQQKLTVNAQTWKMATKGIGIGEGGKKGLHEVVTGYNRFTARLMANIIRDALKLDPIPDVEYEIRVFPDALSRKLVNAEENGMNQIGVRFVSEEHTFAMVYDLVCNHGLMPKDLEKHGVCKYGMAQKYVYASRLASQAPELNLVQRVINGDVKFSKLKPSESNRLAEAIRNAGSVEERNSRIEEAQKFLKDGAVTLKSGVKTKKEIESRQGTSPVGLIQATLAWAANAETELHKQVIMVATKNAAVVNELMAILLEGKTNEIVDALEARRNERLAAASK